MVRVLFVIFGGVGFNMGGLSRNCCVFFDLHGTFRRIFEISPWKVT